ncbi:MAG: hypothetical protein HY904_20170 [Deltaproteobacteria bacterium]|nr:hypothetical protein [Deltaproteobacteria bacterium]
MVTSLLWVSVMWMASQEPAPLEPAPAPAAEAPPAPAPAPETTPAPEPEPAAPEPAAPAPAAEPAPVAEPAPPAAAETPPAPAATPPPEKAFKEPKKQVKPPRAGWSWTGIAAGLSGAAVFAVVFVGGVALQALTIYFWYDQTKADRPYAQRKFATDRARYSQYLSVAIIGAGLAGFFGSLTGATYAFGLGNPDPKTAKDL